MKILECDGPRKYFGEYHTECLVCDGRRHYRITLVAQTLLETGEIREHYVLAPECDHKKCKNTPCGKEVKQILFSALLKIKANEKKMKKDISNQKKELVNKLSLLVKTMKKEHIENLAQNSDINEGLVYQLYLIWDQLKWL